MLICYCVCSPSWRYYTRYCFHGRPKKNLDPLVDDGGTQSEKTKRNKASR